MKKIDYSQFVGVSEDADDIMFMGSIAAIYCPQCKTVDNEVVRNISALGKDEYPAATHHFYKYTCLKCGNERIFERVVRKLVKVSNLS